MKLLNFLNKNYSPKKIFNYLQSKVVKIVKNGDKEYKMFQLFINCMGLSSPYNKSDIWIIKKGWKKYIVTKVQYISGNLIKEYILYSWDDFKKWKNKENKEKDNTLLYSIISMSTGLFCFLTIIGINEFTSLLQLRFSYFDIALIIMAGCVISVLYFSVLDYIGKYC